MSQDIPMKLIIFDFDGTLADTRRNIIMTLQQTMKHHHLEIKDEATCQSTIGLTLENCFLTMYPGMTAEEASKCAQTYRRIFEENKKALVPQLFPNVKKTLLQLHASGITIAIASSRNSASLHGFLHDMDIAHLITYVVGADNVAAHKPSPEPVLQILNKLKTEASETMVVGDMAVDILMGRNAGTQTCAVSYGNGTLRELQESNADHIIDDMADLTHIALSK